MANDDKYLGENEEITVEPETDHRENDQESGDDLANRQELENDQKSGDNIMNREKLENDQERDDDLANTQEFETDQESGDNLTNRQKLDNQTDTNNTRHDASKRPSEMKGKKGERRKWWMSTITAGVIGSLLTLSLSPLFNMNVSSNEGTEPREQVSQQAMGKGNGVTQVSNENGLADVIEDVSQAIVGVVRKQANQHPFMQQNQSVESGTGSGVIFKKEGDKAYIVTNYHVIDGASEIEISLFNGEKEQATVVGTDPLTDLAILEINAAHVTSVAAFGDSSALRIGDKVLAIGNPLGLNLSRTVTQGIVSGTERSIPVRTADGEWDLNVLQTDAAINPGNSGGALINTAGEVIGINSLKISSSGVEGLGFAIPSNDVLPIVDEVMNNGEITRPYIGVSLVDVKDIHPSYLNNLPVDITGGAMIAEVDPQSVSARAGLTVEDIIVAINEEEINGASDVRKYLYTKVDAGDELKFSIYREGKLMFVKVKIDNVEKDVES